MGFVSGNNKGDIAFSSYKISLNEQSLYIQLNFNLQKLADEILCLCNYTIWYLMILVVISRHSDDIIKADYYQKDPYVFSSGRSRLPFPISSVFL